MKKRSPQTILPCLKGKNKELLYQLKKNVTGRIVVNDETINHYTVIDRLIRKS